MFEIGRFDNEAETEPEKWQCTRIHCLSIGVRQFFRPHRFTFRKKGTRQHVSPLFIFIIIVCVNGSVCSDFGYVTFNSQFSFKRKIKGMTIIVVVVVVVISWQKLV